jgi:hypothetical protein
VHNEPFFLPIWLRYYSTFFEPDDIYVLDHDTDDGSTDREGFVRIPVSHDSVDHVWMVETVQALQNELIERYNVVVVTDVDEIVAPDPRTGTLGDYMARMRDDFVNCHGVELIHLRDEEGPYDPALPILDQRHYWFDNYLYNKPALARVPMHWAPGFHTRIDEETNPDPALYLVHLHRLDYCACRARHETRESRQWNNRDLYRGWAFHNRIVAEDEFDQWFYRGLPDPETPLLPRTRIPAHWRGAF